VEEDKVTKDQRAIGKVGVHGGNYGIGYRLAAEVFRIPAKVAKFALEKYHANMPEIESVWWRWIEVQVRAKRILTNQFGRRRVFLGRFDNTTFQIARAFRPQSSISDVNNIAFCRTDLELRKEGIGWPLMPEHDEIVFMLKKDKVHQGVEIIRNAYKVPLRFERTKYPLVIPVDVEIGFNWWDVDDYDKDINYERLGESLNREFPLEVKHG